MFRIKIEIDLAPIIGNQSGRIGLCAPQENYSRRVFGTIAMDAIEGDPLGDESRGTDYAGGIPGYLGC